MSSFLSDFLLLLAATNAGLIAGYLLPRRTALTTAPQPIAPAPSPAENPVDFKAKDEFLLAIQRVTEDVAARVGAHSQQVHAISTELQADGCDITAIITRLVSANDSMERQLAEAETRMKDQAAMIEVHVTQARTDALTGLANRRAFDDEIQKHFDLFKSHATPAALMMLDIDYFKKLNDTYGHLAGDDVLKSTAGLLAKAVRSGDIVSRYGGEEFAVILPQSTAMTVLRLAGQLRETFSQVKPTINGKAVSISASAGMASLLPNDSIKTWIRRADDALYHAKSKGRNCGYWHDGETFQPFEKSIQAELTVTETVMERPAPDVERSLMSLSTFNNCLAILLAENQRDEQSLSVLIARVDRLDRVSELYGTDATRVIQQTIGRLLVSRVGAKCHVAHYGNDSFGIIFPNTRMDEAVVVGLKMRNAIAAMPINFEGTTIDVTVSMGVGDEHSHSPKRPLVERVKEAVSAASKLGGNQVVASKGDGFVQVSTSSSQTGKACAV